MQRREALLRRKYPGTRFSPIWISPIEPLRFPRRPCVLAKTWAETRVKAEITRLRASTSRLVLRRVRKRRESGNGLNARPKATASHRPPDTRVFPLCSRLMRFRLDECERWTQAPGLESAV